MRNLTQFSAEFASLTTIDELECAPSLHNKTFAGRDDVPLITKWMAGAVGSIRRLEAVRGQECVKQAETSSRYIRALIAQRLKWIDKELAKCQA